MAADVASGPAGSGQHGTPSPSQFSACGAPQFKPYSSNSNRAGASLWLAQMPKLAFLPSVCKRAGPTAPRCPAPHPESASFMQYELCRPPCRTVCPWRAGLFAATPPAAPSSPHPRACVHWRLHRPALLCCIWRFHRSRHTPLCCIHSFRSHAFIPLHSSFMPEGLSKPSWLAL